MELLSRVADAYLQTAEGSQAARLRFLEGLWAIQSGFETTDRPYEAPAGDAAREALLSGRPLFFLSTPAVPVAEYVDAVAQIAHYVSEKAGLPAEQVEALNGADFAAAIDAEALASAAVSADAFVAGVAAEMGAQPSGPLTPATVAYVLFSALVPFLTGPAEAAQGVLGEVGQRAGMSGNCPVCGTAASLGRVGETTQLQGGDRILWCGLCHAEWSYERLRCVRCGCRTPDKLRYTHVEGDPAHRVHLCDECHGYMRFVFVTDLGKPVAMVVEDAIATTLDAVALEKGYTATGDGGTGSC